MKKCIALAVSIAVLTVMLFSFNIFSFASQKTDIEKTQLLNSSTYYEFDASTKTLTISGNGAIPNLMSTNTGANAQPWFSWKADGSIQKIVVEDGITSIGNYCFHGVSVADITLPKSLVRLGSYAFAYNDKLQNIDIGNVTTIANNAFYYCTSLKGIYIPLSVEFIGHDAFNSCSSLERVEFESMSANTVIEKSAFLKCASLKRVDVPRYASVGLYAFGHITESSYPVYDDFVLGVYSDSKAYNFVRKSMLEYELLTSMDIYENDVFDCSYFSYTENGVNYSNLNEKIAYVFTPDDFAQYSFYSTGDADVDCVLKAQDGSVINADYYLPDNSVDDLNFTLSCELKAGVTYSFVVESVYSKGDYQLHLERLPVTGNANGTLRALSTPDGDAVQSSFIPYAKLYDGNGDYLGQSDENGYFSVENAYQFIRIVPVYGSERVVNLKYGQSDIGDVLIVSYDYNNDGYVNAKDFAILKKLYGSYDNNDVLLRSLDINGNGVIDAADWQGAEAYLSYGKINESIYGY